MADLNIGNSSASVVINTKHNGSVIPQINNTYDLGTSDLRWKNIYGSTFVGSLNGNAATATNADKLDNKHANEFMYFNYDVGLGSGSPANIAKSYFVDNEKTPKGMIKGYYNDSGEEYSQLYSRSKVGNTGSILKWGYNDRYIRILRHRGGWLSEDWEKIDAGNADTATKLATARSISLDTGVTSTATSFDGSNNITIPVNSIKESYLTWGGRNFNGDYGCIDAAMVSDLGANRLMFGKAAGITIQYSTDGGNNWTDYGASDSEKVGLFSSGCGFNIGKATKDTITANCMLRVIINTDSFGVYTKLNKFVIYLSTNGSSGCYCTIDASLESSPTTFTTFANKVPVSGWSGYNVINTSGITTYGNSPSTQYGLIRFTFGCTGVNTNYPGLNIIQIMGFGGVGWVTPSTMAKTGHLYSYDRSQNAAFPATVTAPRFNGALSGNASTATKATQDSAGQQINTTYIKGLSISGKTITYTKGDGSTGTITTQDTNTTYGVATSSANGLMSSADKSKLDGIAAGANKYSHPTSSGNKHIPAGGSSGQILRWSADGTAVWGADTNTWRGIQNNLTSDSTTDSLSAAQGKALKSLVDSKAASGHTHDDRYYGKSEIDGMLEGKAETEHNHDAYYYRKEEIDEALVAPDWNQNNETAHDYIKNRPFYTDDSVETVLLDNVSVTIEDDGYGRIETQIAFTEGDIYKVEWNGTVYECVAYIPKAEGEPPVVIGNGAIFGLDGGNGEPFIMYSRGRALSLSSSQGPGTYTISITGKKSGIHEIDKKYLGYEVITTTLFNGTVIIPEVV